MEGAIKEKGGGTESDRGLRGKEPYRKVEGAIKEKGGGTVSDRGLRKGTN